MLQFLSHAEDDAVWEKTLRAKFLNVCHTPNSTGVIYVTILPPDFFFHNLSLNSTWSNHLET